MQKIKKKNEKKNYIQNDSYSFPPKSLMYKKEIKRVKKLKKKKRQNNLLRITKIDLLLLLL